MRRRSILLGAALALPSFGVARAQSVADLWPSALPYRPAAAPRPSDVCFSSRQGEMEALTAARAFGANRLDWCYSEDPAFFAAARDAGLETIGGALSTLLPDGPGLETWNVGRAMTRSRTPITPPWLPSGHARWGCINNPYYRAIVYAHARAQLDAGADYFTIDDGKCNVETIRWGGCYCGYCLESARAVGAELPRDMPAFQTRSTIAYLRELREKLNEIAGRAVTVSANNAASESGSIAAPYGFGDFGVSEFPLAKLDPATVLRINASAEAAGRPQVLTLVSDDKAANRRLAAWCYATGGVMLVPYDVFQPRGPRIYGRPEDYADIFKFARRLGPLLDNAAQAPTPPASAWSSTTPGMVASLRGDPGRRFAVLHLVAWRREAPGEVRIDPNAMIPGVEIASARAIWPEGSAPMERRADAFTAAVPATTWLAIELHA